MEVLQTSALPLGYAARKKKWSGKRDLNPRLRPWQGRTLPLSYSRSVVLGDDVAQSGNGQFASDDDAGNPGGHPPEGGKHDQGTGNQQFVRNRVHHLSQVGHQPVAPGQVTVEIVGNGGNAEKQSGQQRREPVGHHQQHHDDRYGDDPEQGQRIGMGEK
jgi:hypothetical protein